MKGIGPRLQTAAPHVLVGRLHAFTGFDKFLLRSEGDRPRPPRLLFDTPAHSVRDNVTVMSRRSRITIHIEVETLNKLIQDRFYVDIELPVDLLYPLIDLVVTVIPPPLNRVQLLDNHLSSDVLVSRTLTHDF